MRIQFPLYPYPHPHGLALICFLRKGPQCHKLLVAGSGSEVWRNVTSVTAALRKRIRTKSKNAILCIQTLLMVLSCHFDAIWANWMTCQVWSKQVTGVWRPGRPGRLLVMPIFVSASDSCGEKLETNVWRRATQPWKESTGKVIFANLEL